MATLFTDNFNRADGAPGGDWTVTTGTWDISANQLRGHTLAAVVKHPTPAAAQTDGLIQFTSGVGADWVNGFWFIIRIRGDLNLQNCYDVTFYSGTTGNAYVRISKRVGGIATIIAEYRNLDLHAGPHTFGVQYIGTTILGLVDGLAVVGCTDGVIANGAWFGLYAGSADKTFLDDCIIYDAQPSQMYVVPSTVPQATNGLTLTLIGVGTQWTPGTPGDPEFTSSNAGITAQTIETVDRAVLTYNSPASPGLVTLTDPNYGRTCQLAVTSGVAGPPSGGSDPFGLYAWLSTQVNRLLAELLRNLLQGVGESTEDYYSRLLTLARTQPVAAVLITMFLALDPDHLGMGGGSPLLANILASAIDTGANLNTLTGSNANSIEDVLLAIAAIEPGGGSEEVLAAIAAVSALLTTTLAEVYYIDGSTSHTLAEVLLAIAGVIDAIGELSFPDLEQLTADIASILSKVDTMDGDGSTTLPAILAAVGALWGGGSKSLLDVWNRADDAYYKADSANTGIGIVGLAVIALPAVIAELLATQTLALTTEMGVQTGVITAAIAAGFELVAGSFEGIALTLSNILSGIGAANDSLDELLTLARNQQRQNALWTGLHGVVVTGSYYREESDTIEGPMDGALLNIANYPTSKHYWTVGASTNIERCGFFAFVGADGYMDERQPIAFTSQVLRPKNVLRPSALVLKIIPGMECTVQTWDWPPLP
jgi:hypothetical protein